MNADRSPIIVSSGHSHPAVICTKSTEARMVVGKRIRRRAARMGVLLRVERELWRAGFARIAGVDEVGVGPLAGPVVAAAVILPADARLREVDDSKKLRSGLREEVAREIRACALGFGIGVVE